MSSVKIILGDFSRSLWQEALARHSKLIIDHYVPSPEYRVQNLVCRENLVQFLDWIKYQTEINHITANICDFSLLCEEFCAFELRAKCDIFSSPIMSLSFSNVQNCNQQIEAISTHIRMLEERIWSSATDDATVRTEFELKVTESLSSITERLSIFETDL
jgi:hypothetical protein